MIALRPYREADLPALHALDQVCFAPGIAYGRAELKSFLTHASSFTAVAAEGDRIAGFAIVRSTRSQLKAFQMQHAPALHLLTIDVAPEVQRRGVGALLMTWISAKAADLAVRAVVLEVAVDNVVAQHFYKKLGFTEAGFIPGYYNGVIDALKLERILDDPQREVSVYPL